MTSSIVYTTSPIVISHNDQLLSSTGQVKFPKNLVQSHNSASLDCNTIVPQLPAIPRYLDSKDVSIIDNIIKTSIAATSEVDITNEGTYI